MIDNADQIAELWDAERCDWRLVHQANFYGNPSSWSVELEWTQEYANQHGADWTTFTWVFYAATAEEAMSDAVRFLEALAPWERCGPCGGENDDHQRNCADCRGTGLANPPQIESATSLESP